MFDNAKTYYYFTYYFFLILGKILIAYIFLTV